MYCRTPPVQPGNPIPKMEPMFASATDSMTPSSTHLTLSIASAKSIRSSRSFSAIDDGSATGGKASRRPGHRRGALAPLVLVEAAALELARPVELVEHAVDHDLRRMGVPPAARALRGLLGGD